MRRGEAVKENAQVRRTKTDGSTISLLLKTNNNRRGMINRGIGKKEVKNSSEVAGEVTETVGELINLIS